MVVLTEREELPNEKCEELFRPIRLRFWRQTDKGGGMGNRPGWKHAAGKLRDNSRHRNASSAAFTTPTKNAGRIDNTMLVQTSYVIMATKTGPHAVSTILPIA